MRRIIVRIALADVVVLKRMATARRISEAGLIRFGLTRFLRTLATGLVPDTLCGSRNSSPQPPVTRLNLSVRDDDLAAIQEAACKLQVSKAAVMREAMVRLIRSDRDRGESVAAVPPTTVPVTRRAI